MTFFIKKKQKRNPVTEKLLEFDLSNFFTRGFFFPGSIPDDIESLSIWSSPIVKFDLIIMLARCPWE